ncbi:hypothetical protein DM02DRAFT_654245 [Periconia macrospinosa]|uniref:Nab2-like CCCH zinc finger domain-containing protein n=1 Tax=Periconia macrospinosa TaxID=97972 RepID=A0A2V1DTX5_9PLEO|nr:hypothetical protein DM02DRAFT_654245 [Periconia macrospinosa]
MIAALPADTTVTLRLKDTAQPLSFRSCLSWIGALLLYRPSFIGRAKQTRDQIAPTRRHFLPPFISNHPTSAPPKKVVRSLNSQSSSVSFNMEEFAAGTQLSTELQLVVQPKLVECGWTTSADDTTLFDYILLMLANDKNEAQVASELSNDLLDLGPENAETQQFARWLFEQIDTLRRQLNGGNVAGDAQMAHADQNQMDGASNDAPANAQDTDMEGITEPTTGNMYANSQISFSPSSTVSDQRQDNTRGLPIPSVDWSSRESSPTSQPYHQPGMKRYSLTHYRPTGPKAMRNGSGPKAARGGRMLNQMNKSMNRHDDSALHRVRGSQGTGRVGNTREPPKGPRNASQVGRGLDALANGRGMNNMNMVPGNANNGMNNMNAMPGMPMAGGMGQSGMPGMLNPSQQMALMNMYEQQANMMQQIFAGQVPQPFVNPSFTHNNRGGKKFSGGNRAGQGNKQNLPSSSKFTKKEGQDEVMTDGAAAENGNGMEVETSRPDPSTTICHFNQRCMKADCPFVHASPAAPRGVTIDMNVTCEYGPACKNNKCVGKHPSPAQKQQYQAEQECAFWPNCRDPKTCPYMHPTVPACRNGADCTTPGCTFHHSKIVCKFNPCTRLGCPYKHAEGQKQGAAKSNVWVAPKNGDGSTDHVSERKFVDETKEEEVIIPKKEERNTEMVEAAL